MPDDVTSAEYLLESAARLKDLAPNCDLASAAKMLELADELEAKAARLSEHSQPLAE